MDLYLIISKKKNYLQKYAIANSTGKHKYRKKLDLLLLPNITNLLQKNKEKGNK